MSGVTSWIYFREFWIRILLNQKVGQRYWTLVCSTEDPQAHEMNIEEVSEGTVLGRTLKKGREKRKQLEEPSFRITSRIILRHKN